MDEPEPVWFIPESGRGTGQRLGNGEGMSVYGVFIPSKLPSMSSLPVEHSHIRVLFMTISGYHIPCIYVYLYLAMRKFGAWKCRYVNTCMQIKSEAFEYIGRKGKCLIYTYIIASVLHIYASIIYIKIWEAGEVVSLLGLCKKKNDKFMPICFFHHETADFCVNRQSEMQ